MFSPDNSADLGTTCFKNNKPSDQEESQFGPVGSWEDQVKACSAEVSEDCWTPRDGGDTHLTQLKGPEFLIDAAAAIQVLAVPKPWISSITVLETNLSYTTLGKPSNKYYWFKKSALWAGLEDHISLRSHC